MRDGYDADGYYVSVPELSRRDLSRRDWMERVLQSVGGLALATGVGVAQEQANWSPQFFSAEQNETFVALGERIIPGSAEAQCNRIVDLMLTLESDKTKQQTVQALAAFDGEAQSRFQKRFRESTPEQQDRILSAAAADGAPLHAQFQLLKEWTADAYWSSQKGLRELGSTGRMAWESFPNCGNPEPHN